MTIYDLVVEIQGELKNKNFKNDPIIIEAMAGVLRSVTGEESLNQVDTLEILLANKERVRELAKKGIEREKKRDKKEFPTNNFDRSGNDLSNGNRRIGSKPSGDDQWEVFSTWGQGVFRPAKSLNQICYIPKKKKFRERIHFPEDFAEGRLPSRKVKHLPSEDDPLIEQFYRSYDDQLLKWLELPWVKEGVDYRGGDHAGDVLEYIIRHRRLDEKVSSPRVARALKLPLRTVERRRNWLRDNKKWLYDLLVWVSDGDISFTVAEINPFYGV